ncbi:HD-GYP domain-containing protein [Aestuariirhabdus sp. LZHN29]|uniref:HD-GYP domain-containing protein n=1 Tax=Aestuariirhabdus sp. LZHN29 TaxID=3417462 RepID=UPI003CF32CC5
MSEQKKTVSQSPDELCLGMYVKLPNSWLDHPFLRNEFLIKTEAQLEKLRNCKINRFDIDLGKSELPANWHADSGNATDVAHPEPAVDVTAPAPEKWNADNLVPEALQEALHDKKLNPEKRSEAVYHHSRELMDRLLETPTAENLKASKKAIFQVTDMILHDPETASNMLRITSHDFYTYTHSVNVGVTSIMLAKALFGQSDQHDMQELGAGFFLHDLGKVNVRPEVINKPGKLTDDEMRHMRTHPFKGFKLMEQSGELTEESRIIVLQHHERADGTGYPKQLHNEEIHIYGKICCIADVFDALTAERSYKKAMTPFQALVLMRDQMSDHFDKKLFTEFVNLMR